MIELQATCQTLKTCCHDMLVSDSLNAIKMRFVFSDEWDGLVKTAQFTQKNNETGDFVTYNVLLDEDETAMLPNEIESGVVLVSVFGVDNIERMTTNTVAFPVMKSGFVGDGQTPIPPTPDLYQQLLMKVFNTAGSPVIGENGNWYLDNIDTGVKADWSAEQENAAASAKAAADSETAAKESEEQAAAASKAIQENQAALVEQVEKNTANLLTKAPAIECEASGSVVTVTDAAAQPAVQLVTHIEPVQDGEGDPSPDNVRPISGWNKVAAQSAGKNLYPGSDLAFKASKQVMLSTPLPPGTYTVGALVTSLDTDANISSVVFLDEKRQSNTFFGLERNVYNAATRYCDKPIYGFVFYASMYYSGSADDECSWTNIMINAGETALPYEPDQGGQTLTAALPETVYGGTVDWNIGAAQPDLMPTVFDGDEGWRMYSTTNGNGFYIELGGFADSKRQVLADKLKYIGEFDGGSYFIANANVNECCTLRGSTRFYVKSDAATVEEFKARLAADPITVVHSCTTMQPIQLTPQQLSMLKGTNNVWSDTGDTSLVYVADTKSYIDNKIAAIAAAIVNG